MAVDTKKILTGLKERKETTLVWGLGAIAFVLGIFLLIGYMRGVSPPPSLEVIVKRKKLLKSKEEIAEEAIARLRESQRIPPLVDYHDILTKNLFVQSRMARIEPKPIVGVGGFVLKGIWKEMERIVALVQDPGGKAHVVETGQMIGTSEVKVGAIDFENQSMALLGKGWKKPQVIRLARETLREKALITFRPSEEKKEVEKPKGVPEEEAKKAVAGAKGALAKANSVIVSATDVEAEVARAIDKRNLAKNRLREAERAYGEKDYLRAKELAREAKNLAQQAIKISQEAIEEKKRIEREEWEEEDDEEESGGTAE